MNITVKNVPKLRFKSKLEQNFSNWQEKKLGDVFSIFSGYSFSSNDSRSNGIKWLKIADVGIQVMNSDNPSFLPEGFDKKYSKFLVELNDYVIALTRPILDHKLKISKINLEYSGALLNQRVGKLLTDENIDFVYYLLQCTKIINSIENKIDGSDPPNLSSMNIKDICCFIPSLPEQQKIADFLRSVDNKIQALKQQQQLLLQYKKGMMQKLFSQQIRFKDENGQDYPEWELYKLSDISEINPRNEKLPKEFVYIDLESVEKGNLIHQKHVLLKNAPSRAQRILKKNDILFQLVRPYQQNNFLFNLDNNNYVASTGYAQIRTKQNQEYLYQLLNTDFILNKVLELCTGTSYPAINSNDLGSISFNICSFPEQQKIADCLSAIDQKIELVNKKISYTEQFKQGLLQQLFV